MTTTCPESDRRCRLVRDHVTTIPSALPLTWRVWWDSVGVNRRDEDPKCEPVMMIEVACDLRPAEVHLWVNQRAISDREADLFFDDPAKDLTPLGRAYMLLAFGSGYDRAMETHLSPRGRDYLYHLASAMIREMEQAMAEAVE